MAAAALGGRVVPLEGRELCRVHTPGKRAIRLVVVLDENAFWPEISRAPTHPGRTSSFAAVETTM